MDAVPASKSCLAMYVALIAMYVSVLTYVRRPNWDDPGSSRFSTDPKRLEKPVAKHVRFVA